MPFGSLASQAAVGLPMPKVRVACLKSRGRLQPVDRGLGQQRAFGAGIDQHGHRFIVDLRLDEQQVAPYLERHFGERDQRAGAIRAASRRRVARAARNAEQNQQDQHGAHHGVALTWTEARTAAPSASSTVSR